MGITKQDLNKAFEQYGSKYGGVREDYFALLYLSKEFEKPIEKIADQVTFGGNDYGFDGYFIDRETRNLYLFQFKWSENYSLFKDSYQRLINAGMERIFGNPYQDNEVNPLLIKLKSDLFQQQSIIDKVFIHFVFNGEPSSAESSSVLESLREDLESKKYLIDQYFENRKVSLTTQYVSNQTKSLAVPTHVKQTHCYEIFIDERLETYLPTGELMFLGFVSLHDLYLMYKEMGLRFLERNIRAILSRDKAPNKSLRKAYEKIVIDGSDDPGVFVFNHNGVTISAERLEFNDGKAIIVEPRLLNGAQTVTNLAMFIDDNKDNQGLIKNYEKLKAIKVLTKIITKSSDDFIVNVTICNNRQNPVEPWHLRASDLIQLQFQDKFKDELKIHYERQEGTFENMTDADLDEMGIEQKYAIGIKSLAQTFLSAQGELDKMSRLRDVFEADKIYRNTFKESYLKADARYILLAYKIRLKLKRIINDIKERGENKYHYIEKGRNLIWALLLQGVLNDDRVTEMADLYGTGISMETDYSEYLRDMASRKIRFLINEATQDKRYAKYLEKDSWSFLTTKTVFNHCMEIAYKRYRWEKKTF